MILAILEKSETKAVGTLFKVGMKQAILRLKSEYLLRKLDFIHQKSIKSDWASSKFDVSLNDYKNNVSFFLYNSAPMHHLK